jgi:hypothetical protein
MIELTPEFVERYATASKHEQRVLSQQMHFEHKFSMGGLLFDRECKIIESMIRETFPDAKDADVRAMRQRVVDWYHGRD